MTDSFSRSIWVSVSMHLVLVLFLFVRAVTAPTENLQIREAIRVDMVDLPDKQAELPAPAAAKAEPVETAKPEPKKPETKPEPPAPKSSPKVPIKKTKDTTKSQQAAMNKLKAMEAMDKIKGEVAKENAPKPKVVKGNVVSAGNSLSGLDKIDYDKYFDEIKDKVFANWSIPTWMADNDTLKATVTVMIDERGFVIKKAIRRSSGNDIFDGKCLDAVANSSPFSPPPERLRGVLSTSGINFNFPQ